MTGGNSDYPADFRRVTLIPLRTDTFLVEKSACPKRMISDWSLNQLRADIRSGTSCANCNKEHSVLSLLQETNNIPAGSLLS